MLQLFLLRSISRTAICISSPVARSAYTAQVGETLIASEQDRPDVARRRAQWLRYRHRIDPGRLVFIDETWTKASMAPRLDR